MPRADFLFPSLVRFGTGELQGLPDLLADFGIRRPLLVTDAGVARSDAFAQVEGISPDPIVFSRSAPCPPESVILNGEQAYAAARCDGILATGGGGVMDTAKAIRVRVSHGRDLTDFAYGRRIHAPMPPLIAVPTLPGSGRESAPHFDFTSGDRRWRVTGVALCPSAVLIDPDLLASSPEELRIAAAESCRLHLRDLARPRALHPMCEAAARQGSAVLQHAEDAESLALASLLLGLAEQSGGAPVTALVYAVSDCFGLSYAAAARAIAATPLKYATESVRDRAAQILGELDLAPLDPNEA